jgi:hypothetical protein
MSSNSKALTWWMGSALVIAAVAYGVIQWLTGVDPFYAAPASELFLGLSDVGRTDLMTALLVAAWLAATTTFLSKRGSTLWLFAILAFYLVGPLSQQLHNLAQVRPETIIPWEALGHGLGLDLDGVTTFTWGGAAAEMALLIVPGFKNLGPSRFGLTHVIGIGLLTGTITFAAAYFGPQILTDGMPDAALGFIGYAGFVGASPGPKWPMVAFAALFALSLFISPLIALAVFATGVIGHVTRALGEQ